MKMKKLIGIENFKSEDLKKEYREKFKNSAYGITAAEIYLDKKSKYGVVVELHNWWYAWDKAFTPKKLTKAEKKKIDARQKRLKKKYEERRKKGLPEVDTSKWVRPDRESIKRELIINLISLELLNKDCWRFKECFSKVETLYGVLYSRDPRNPQSLTNFALFEQEALEKILSVIKHKEAGMSYRLMDFKKGKKFDYDKYLYDVTIWREKLKVAIIKPIYKHLKKKNISEKKFNEIKKGIELPEKEKKKLRKEMKERKLEQEKNRRHIEYVISKAKKEFKFVPFWSKNKVKKNGRKK